MPQGVGHSSSKYLHEVEGCILWERHVPWVLLILKPTTPKDFFPMKPNKHYGF
jgi:hypothetical protein